MFVKICGLNSAEAVEAAVEAGADALGFVFAESPREVTPERARELCAAVPRTASRASPCMRHPPAELWRRVLEMFEPDWLQTDADDFARRSTLPLGSVRAARVSRRRRACRRRPAGPRCCSKARRAAAARAADWDAAARARAAHAS